MGRLVERMDKSAKTEGLMLLLQPCVQYPRQIAGEKLRVSLIAQGLPGSQETAEDSQATVLPPHHAVLLTNVILCFL